MASCPGSGGTPGKGEPGAIIFGVVLFSLLGQGLTLPGVIRRLGLSQEAAANAEPIFPAAGME
jgi:NhaP-type Na+/H+ or K+/H+ antiporter